MQSRVVCAYMQGCQDNLTFSVRCNYDLYFPTELVYFSIKDFTSHEHSTNMKHLHTSGEVSLVMVGEIGPLFVILAFSMPTFGNFRFQSV